MTTIPAGDRPLPQAPGFWKQPRFWIGLAVSALFVWLALRNISWAGVVAALRDAQWAWVLAGLLLLAATWAVFALRWQVLLAAAGVVSWRDSFSYILVGYLGNVALPLRLGDVVRIVLLSKKCQADVVIVSTTVILERILDVLTIVVLAGLLAAMLPLPALIARTVQSAALAVAVAFVILALLARSQPVLDRVEAFVSAHLPARITSTLFRILNRFVQGLRVTGGPAQLLKVLGLSAASWSIASLALLCFVKAFQLPVPWQAGILVLVVTNLGGAIPSSPGAIGVYEFCAMVALSAWSLDRSLAAGFALVSHAASLALTVGLGLAATYREGMGLSALQAAGRPDAFGRNPVHSASGHE